MKIGQERPLWAEVRGHVRGSCADVEKSIKGKWNSQCKGPEVTRGMRESVSATEGLVGREDLDYYST